MTVTCICCDRPGDPSAAMPQFCVQCWQNIPQVTQQLYLHGGLKRPQFITLARERNASIRATGGGRSR